MPCICVFYIGLVRLCVKIRRSSIYSLKIFLILIFFISLSITKTFSFCDWEVLFVHEKICKSKTIKSKSFDLIYGICFPWNSPRMIALIFEVIYY